MSHLHDIRGGVTDGRSDGWTDQSTNGYRPSYDSVPTKPTFRVSKWVKIENIQWELDLTSLEGPGYFGR